ncbi:hypothetical protein RHOFW104T7_00160 [Rhodanobacter thiooxydans]|uniref:Uncharacterized protein n=1 Tax=Rhodanobacter thiooxydans TaxID=416169 RepID=A0A154QE46_9GAMM|nr:hypothetical protein RHOFW104T7_00160 [Rhodanobacter thiooxydans]
MERISFRIEYSVRRQQAQDTAERIRISAEILGEFLCGSWHGVYKIRNAQVSDHVQTSRYAIPAGDLLQGVEWGVLSHVASHACSRMV